MKIDLMNFSGSDCIEIVEILRGQDFEGKVKHLTELIDSLNYNEVDVVKEEDPEKFLRLKSIFDKFREEIEFIEKSTL